MKIFVSYRRADSEYVVDLGCLNRSSAQDRFRQPTATYSNFVVETGIFVDKHNTDHKHVDFLYALGVQYTDDQFYGFIISAKNKSWQIVKGTLATEAQIGATSDLEVIQSGEEGSIRGASEEEEDRLTVIANGTEFIYYVNGNLLKSRHLTGDALATARRIPV